ncbi:hypothetical protein [Streptomyces swartbergensis]|uniref:hypothetical protein n=1 Tax=Streptomyces swartbergensis TaxID=487165 RepID=UPI0013028548|nr:hypothetical protein [Streptomyces swartbergensis]
MPARIAADFRIDAVDLAPADFDELRARLEEVAAAYKADVTVLHREYDTQQ